MSFWWLIFLPAAQQESRSTWFLGYLCLVSCLVGKMSCSKLSSTFELKLVIAENQFPKNLPASVCFLLFVKRLLLIVVPKLEERTISVSEALALKDLGKQELRNWSITPC